MKEYAIIYCIQVLWYSVYRDMYKIYIGNKIRNLTQFYDDSYYIASHKKSIIFWGYVKNTHSEQLLVIHTKAMLHFGIVCVGISSDDFCNFL